MNMFQRMLIFSRKRAKADKDVKREQRVIKLDNNTYQLVWADEYDKWVDYLKDTGKLK